MAERCYAECHLSWLSLILSVTYKPFMPNVIMVSVVILNVIMMSVVAPNNVLTSFGKADDKMNLVTVLSNLSASSPTAR